MHYVRENYNNLICSGNIVTGNDTQTDAVLQGNALPVLAKLLQHPKLNLVKAGFKVLKLSLSFISWSVL